MVFKYLFGGGLPFAFLFVSFFKWRWRMRVTLGAMKVTCDISLHETLIGYYDVITYVHYVFTFARACTCSSN